MTDDDRIRRGDRERRDNADRRHDLLNYRAPTAHQLGEELAINLVREKIGDAGLPVITVMRLEAPQDYASAYDRGVKLAALRAKITKAIEEVLVDAGIVKTPNDRITRTR